MLRPEFVRLAHNILNLGILNKPGFEKPVGNQTFIKKKIPEGFKSMNTINPNCTSQKDVSICCHLF